MLGAVTSANNKPSKPQVDDLTVTPVGRNGVVASFRYSPEPDQWVASGDVARGATGLVISRLEMRPGTLARGGVTGGVMRKIQVGELLGAIRNKLLGDALNTLGVGFEPHDLTQLAWQTAQPTLQERLHGHRVVLDDRVLREIALAYLAETQPGAPAGAMKRMAEALGRPEETVRTWVARARREGWLGPSVKGRAGAEPGPRLLAAEQETQRDTD